jgi:hypothetical protein
MDLSISDPNFHVLVVGAGKLTTSSLVDWKRAINVVL